MSAGPMAKRPDVSERLSVREIRLAIPRELAVECLRQLDGTLLPALRKFGWSAGSSSILHAQECIRVRATDSGLLLVTEPEGSLDGYESSPYRQQAISIELVDDAEDTVVVVRPQSRPLSTASKLGIVLAANFVFLTLLSAFGGRPLWHVVVHILGVVAALVAVVRPLRASRRQRLELAAAVQRALGPYERVGPPGENPYRDS